MLGFKRRNLLRRAMENHSGMPSAGTSAAKPVVEAVSGQAEVLPHAAALCDGELVALESSEGRIASQFLVPYPPGIPVFIPGLRISKAMIRLVKDVIAADGPGAVHGLFCRGGHAPYLVEVLNRDEEARATAISRSQCALPSFRGASSRSR